MIPIMILIQVSTYHREIQLLLTKKIKLVPTYNTVVIAKEVKIK